MFVSINHKDFVLIWLHFLPGLFMLWQLIALNMGLSHYFFIFNNTTNYFMISSTITMCAAWLFAKTGYYVFYPISYTLESKLNKWIKIANMSVIFSFSIFLTYALFDHFDSKQYELGYLTIFIILTLLVLNVIVTLNPIARE